MNASNKMSLSLRFVSLCYLFLLALPILTIWAIMPLPVVCVMALALAIADFWQGRNYRWYGLALSLALFPVSYMAWHYCVCLVSNPFRLPDYCHRIFGF